MRAISLWQPWASLWLSDRKIHETRHWRIQVPAGGVWMAVHATKRLELKLPPELLEIVEDQFGPHWALELPRAAIIGRVLIDACIPTSQLVGSADLSADDLACGNFGPSRFGWRRTRYERLAQPVAWKGQQGLFNVPDDLFAKAA